MAKRGPKSGSKNTTRKQAFQDFDRVMVALALAYIDLGYSKGNAVDLAIRYLYGNAENSCVRPINGKHRVDWLTETIVAKDAFDGVPQRVIKVESLQKSIARKVSIHVKKNAKRGKIPELDYRPGINLKLGPLTVSVLTGDIDWIEAARCAYKRWNSGIPTQASQGELDAKRLERMLYLPKII